MIAARSSSLLLGGGHQRHILGCTFRVLSDVRHSVSTVRAAYGRLIHGLDSTIERSKVFLRVDAHHHLWRYTDQEYPWIDESMQLLKQDYLPASFSGVMAAAGVQASIAVQARQTLEETRWLLEMSARSPAIRGVVGWVPIESPHLRDILDDLRKEPGLRGLRHVVQSEPEGFLDGASFNHGIASLRETGLVYDLLIFGHQMPEAARFVDRHPSQMFVLDHVGKPNIREGRLQSWSADIREVARRDNVVCKVSGMVTEADWAQWTPEQLYPYFETVLEAFGPSRLMVGSDWPVLTLACSYTRWWQLIESWLTPLSRVERDLIESSVASQVYGITVSEADVAGNGGSPDE